MWHVTWQHMHCECGLCMSIQRAMVLIGNTKQAISEGNFPFGLVKTWQVATALQGQQAQNAYGARNEAPAWWKWDIVSAFVKRRGLAHPMLQPCVHHTMGDPTHLQLSHSFWFLLCIMCSCENGWENVEMMMVILRLWSNSSCWNGPLEDSTHVNFSFLSSSRLV